MRAVSEEYKDLMSEQFREQTQVNIDLYVSDTTLEDEAESRVKYEDTAYYSGTAFPRAHKVDCATFEQDFMKVGGNLCISRTEEDITKTNIVNLANIKVEHTSPNDIVVFSPGEGSLQLAPNTGSAFGTWEFIVSSPDFIIKSAGHYYFNAFLTGSTVVFPPALYILIYDNEGTLISSSHSSSTEVSDLGTLQRGYTYKLKYSGSGSMIGTEATFYPMISTLPPTEFAVYKDDRKENAYPNIVVSDDIGGVVSVQAGGFTEIDMPVSHITVICPEVQSQITVRVRVARGVLEYSVENTAEYSLDLSALGTVAAILVLATGTEDRRGRIKDIVLGEVLHYGMSEIVSADWEQQADAITSQLPITTCRFSVSNLNHEYDVDNPTGVYAKIKRLQRVYVSTTIGHSVTDLGCLFLSDTPTVNGNTAEFEAMDALQYMDFNTFPSGSYTFGAFTEENIPKSRIATVGFKYLDYPADVYNFPGVNSDLNFNEAVQGWASVIGCPLMSPDEGNIAFGYRQSWYNTRARQLLEDYYDPTFKIDIRDWQVDSPTATKAPLVRNLNTSYRQFTPSTANRIEVSGSATPGQALTLMYPVGLRLALILPYSISFSGATVSSYTVYNDRIVLTTSTAGTVSVTITNTQSGGIYTEESVDEIVKVNPDGEDLDYNSPFYVKGTAYARSIGFRSALLNHTSAYDKQLKYSGTYMQDIRTQAGDLLLFDTPFSTDNVGFVESLHFNLTSCWGEITLRRLN